MILSFGATDNANSDPPVVSIPIDAVEPDGSKAPAGTSDVGGLLVGHWTGRAMPDLLLIRSSTSATAPSLKRTM